MAGLDDDGVVMFTAVDVREVHSRQDGGVHVDATVGLTLPVWAAAPEVSRRRARPARSTSWPCFRCG